MNLIKESDIFANLSNEKGNIRTTTSNGTYFRI